MQAFLSYRRTDQWIVDRLSHELKRAFGDEAVFRDIDGLAAGWGWEKQLDDALTRCDVLLAVIPPGWISGDR
jgi:hypothetical protein